MFLLEIFIASKGQSAFYKIFAFIIFSINVIKIPVALFTHTKNHNKLIFYKKEKMYLHFII